MPELNEYLSSTTLEVFGKRYGECTGMKGRRNNGEPRLSFEAEKTTFDISLYVYRLYSEYRKRFKDTRNGFKLLVIISILKLRIL